MTTVEMTTSSRSTTMFTVLYHTIRIRNKYANHSAADILLQQQMPYLIMLMRAPAKHNKNA